MSWNKRTPRAVMVVLLCAFIPACQSTGLGSGLVGDLGGFGRDVQVKAYGIRGTVLDVTGLLAAVQDEGSHTIFTVVVPQPGPEGLQPGITVEVSGVFSDGLIRARSIAVTGGRAWPQPADPAEDDGRISHVLFLLQVNNKAETCCTRDIRNFFLLQWWHPKAPHFEGSRYQRATGQGLF